MPPNYQELVALVTDPSCTIEELDLSIKQITDGWIRQFLNVLKDDNHSVKRIDLRNNYLTNTGAFYISYILRADLDPAEMDLIELNLADNYITNETLLNEIESALVRNQQLATTTISATTSIPPTLASSTPATPPTSLTATPPSTPVTSADTPSTPSDTPPTLTGTPPTPQGTPPTPQGTPPTPQGTPPTSQGTQPTLTGTPAAPTDITSTLAVAAPTDTSSHAARSTTLTLLQNATTRTSTPQQTNITTQGGSTLTPTNPSQSGVSSGAAGVSTLMIGLIIGGAVVVIMAVVIWTTKTYKRRQRPSRTNVFPPQNTPSSVRMGLSALMSNGTAPYAFPDLATEDGDYDGQPYAVFGTATGTISPGAAVNDYVYNEAWAGFPDEAENYYSIPGEGGEIYAFVTTANSADYEQPVPLPQQPRHYDRAVEPRQPHLSTDSNGYERPVPLSLQNGEAGMVFGFDHQPGLYALASSEIAEHAPASPLYDEAGSESDFEEAFYDEASNEVGFMSPARLAPASRA